MLTESKPKVRLAILLSGRGTNCEAIASACQDGRLPGCEVAVVMSNVPGAPGIVRAKELGLTSLTLEGRGRERLEHEQAVSSLLRKFRADIVCLAGYKRVLSPSFVTEWKDRVLNIHPSLLPAFPGMHAQRQALAYGVPFTGCTVHFVDESVDGGVIIVQRTVDVLDDDTEDTLSDRLLTVEHLAYVEAINHVVSGEYEIRDRRYVRRLGSAIEDTSVSSETAA